MAIIAPIEPPIKARPKKCNYSYAQLAFNGIRLIDSKGYEWCHIEGYELP